MKHVAKEIPEGINVTPRHPLLNFTYLLGTVVIVSVLIFVALGFVADWLAPRISPETEQKIGEMLLPLIVSEEQEIEEDKRIEYLKTLLDFLPQSDETTRLPLTLHLIENENINAAITAGGHVLIHTALLEAVESENELALVLGHELGHFQSHDPTKSLGRSLVFLVVSMALGIGTSQSGGISDIVPLTGELTNLSYSRKQEKAADVYGLARVVNYYGHGGHCLEFFNRLEQKDGESRMLKVSQYFSTHPLSEDRIQYLKQVATEKGWKMEGEATSLPEWINCPNMEECEPEEE